MNYAFLPDLFALTVLIAILAMVRRRHSDPRGDAWLLGLTFTFIESLAHTLYERAGVPARILHVTVLDCYVLAGMAFSWASSDQRVPRATRLLYLSLNGIALLGLTTVYGCNVRVTTPYVPVVVVGMVIGVISSLAI